MSCKQPAPLLTLLFSFPLLVTEDDPPHQPIELLHIFKINRSNSFTSPRSADRTPFLPVSIDLHQKATICSRWMSLTPEYSINVVESSSATSPQSSSRYPPISKCLVKLESILSVSSNDELYVWAARLFLRDKRRECFMTLPTDEVQLRFLNLEIEMEKTTIGYCS
ncbi:hypothetical protein ACSBR1_042726 [Camellia fascicularis]